MDALSLALILILPSAVISYALAVSGSVKAISIVWAIALGILMFGMIVRDGFRGRSLGKQLLGLRLLTPRGEGCGWGRSIVRNLPLLIPVWNVVEVGMVLAGKPRTGDRIAHTTVTEE